MNYELIRSIEALVTPPGLMLLMIIVGLLIGNYFTRLARGLILTGILLLAISSFPATGLLAYKLLESDPPLTEAALEKSSAQAIVILGGGRYEGFEYHKETVSISTLERLRYGAWLHQQTGLPILVTGGSVRGERVSEARLMAQTLTSIFQVKPQWVEENSRNTYENAQKSSQLLSKSGIKSILLVTHAGHMWRSKTVFKRFGLQINPAPLGFKSRVDFEFLHFLPSARGMEYLRITSHEFIGYLWYLLRY